MKSFEDNLDSTNLNLEDWEESETYRINLISESEIHLIKISIKQYDGYL